MRALLATCALIALTVAPAFAQSPQPRFLKVDITSKHAMGCAKGGDGPTEVHLRMPISLAKGILDMAVDGHLKLHGKGHAALNPEQLTQLIAAAKPGDLLVEITTNTGDLVKVVVE